MSASGPHGQELAGAITMPPMHSAASDGRPMLTVHQPSGRAVPRHRNDFVGFVWVTDTKRHATECADVINDLLNGW